jgi:cell shape-determining protein MreC
MALAQPKHARNALPIAVALCAVLAITPARWQGWVRPLGTLAEVLVAPISGPINRLRSWIAPHPRPADDAEVERLRQENAELRTRVLAASSEAQRLRELLAQQRVIVRAGEDVDHVPASVVASSPNASNPVLTVRAGSREGVSQGALATLGFSTLVGRVSDVRSRTSSIIPVTSRSFGDFDGVVLTRSARGVDSPTLRTRLTPRGDATLVGDIEDKRDASGQPILPQPGDEVRLSDMTRFPAHAQMLLVGTVVEVAPSPRQPLRRIITVRAAAEDPTRLSEVLLRLTREDQPRAEGPR